jgi:TRAP-type mannitol/chloroaromatic compound transport system permease small subunit
MPSLTFVLPHWLYWAGLIVFPLIAMYLARRTKARGAPRGYSLPLGYMILVAGGMLGLHRYYLKSMLGLIYLPIFIFILVANGEQRDARAQYSDASNLVVRAEETVKTEAPRLKIAEASIAELQAAVDSAEAGSLGRRVAESKLKRAQTQLSLQRDRLARAETDLKEQTPIADATNRARSFWRSMALYAFWLILLMLAIDALLLPRLKRQAEAKVAQEDTAEIDATIDAIEAVEQRDDYSRISTGWTGVIDRMSYYTGEMVSYWAVIAVFVYYYEVIARYVFNSPTNWAHEGMYLMFGMQYLIAGAYAMLCESHVRVDVFYAPMSPRHKAIVDLATSVFFYIFAGTLLGTSIIFAWDATKVGEISFSDWKIAYWPMKWAMVLGGLLLVLQGISKMAQDIRAVFSPAREA